MKIIGLDLSLTSTGIADGKTTRTIRVKLEPHASDLLRAIRLQRVAVAVGWACIGAKLVVLEGPSFHSEMSAHPLGELAGVVKVNLLEREIPFVVIPPAKLKKYATGRGNSPKDEVFAAAIRAGSPANNNDEADAWWLWHMANEFYADLYSSKVRKEVLESIEWPQVKTKEKAV